MGKSARLPRSSPWQWKKQDSLCALFASCWENGMYSCFIAKIVSQKGNIGVVVIASPMNPYVSQYRGQTVDPSGKKTPHPDPHLR